MECDTSYIGETGRDLHKRIVEHKAAIRRKDDTKVLEQEPRYWRRRILEAIHIQKNTSNLDCGLALNAIWTPFLER